MPMYMLPNVNALLKRSVKKYREARFQMLSKGCSAMRYGKKLGRTIAR